MYRYLLPKFGCGFIIPALLLQGCGGIDFGGEIRVPADQRHVLKADKLSDLTLHLPVDRPFNIHVKKSSQNPGADGLAHGESDANAMGNALSSAETSKGGSASAEFNIGHRIENLSGSPQSVTVQIDYELTHSIKASYIPKAETIATAHLYLLINDSKKRSIAKIPVVQISSDEATTKASSKDSHTLSARFEPGQTYDVVLFGKVDASATSGQEAAAQLSVKQLKMHFTFEPAATQPAEK